jgi:hypothetical protein
MGQRFAITLILLCVSCATAQTPFDLQKRYGKPIASYIVSEHILLTPEYATDGQICQMRLHPRHYSADTNYVSASLPSKELMKVLGELVPLRTRGVKKDPFNKGATGGGAEWMIYTYENVEFSFISSFHVDPEVWKKKREFVFTVDPGSMPPPTKQKISTPSENDFSPSEASIIELVNIKWRGRQCSTQ